jgi:acetyl-CoA C-acetyltransferase
MIQSLSSAPPAPRWAPSRAIFPRRPPATWAPWRSRPPSSAPASTRKLVEHVYFGNCLMAGQGQAPARQALIKAGLPMSTGAVTLSKMCGSAMQAAIFAHDQLVAGSADVVVAGGMESMTNAPYLIPKARGGYRIGHAPMFDHMMLRRPRRRLLAQREDRRRPLDGHLRRRVRGQVPVHARSAGQLRDRIGQARAGRQQRRQLRMGNRAGDRRQPPGDTVIDKDEGPLKAKVDKIPTLRRPSRRTAPSPPPRRRRSTTAPPRWS